MNIAVMMNAPTNHKEIGEAANAILGPCFIFNGDGALARKATDKLIAGLVNMMDAWLLDPNITVKRSLPICSSEPYPRCRTSHLYLQRRWHSLTLTGAFLAWTVFLCCRSGRRYIREAAADVYR